VHLVEIVRIADARRREEVIGFVDRVTSRVGARPLSDHLWLDLRAGGSDGFLLVRAADEHGTIAIAQISAANDTSSLEVVVDPGLPADRRQQVGDDVTTTAVDAFRRSGGGHLDWWVDDADEHVHDLASRMGLSPLRSLHEMRRPLPVGRHAEVATRSFRPGTDDAEWVAVNNRAFAGHGEQGGWTIETLRLRMAEPWFDPAGFRIHERDGRIAAFCWTKLHHELDPVVGEIYVIAVDPAHHGTGLGTQLTLAGLDSITDRGVRLANLYVDADNAAAIGLYDRLGFAIHRTRTAFGGHVPPADAADT